MRAGEKKQLFIEACIMEFSVSLSADLLFQTVGSHLFVEDTQ